MIISILCGGSGTRLWPISRATMPKQFAKLMDDDSLFTKTIQRNMEFLDSGAELQIITNDDHYFLALDALEEVNVATPVFILEAISKNTAAALTMSAILTAKNNPDDIIVALPSDHLIKDEKKYHKCIQEACSLAKQGYIVTFGITPTSPHTGYGYIQAVQCKKTQSHSVLGFYEKPDIQKAEQYLKEGNFYWNSGMFCYQARVLLEEMQKYEPDIYIMCLEALEAACKQANFVRLPRDISQKIPSQSIDYALMEKTKKLTMVVADFTWNDVGSFDSLAQEFTKDSNHNASNTQLLSLHSCNNFVLSNKTVATVGLEDYVVVDTADALLIAKKGQTQDVKDIVEMLKQHDKALTQNHNQTFRPWGSYTVLQEHKTYKLKSITVKPKHRLSLQKHFHRNEHWIIVSGSALVQIDEEEIFLQPNQSTYIPMGKVHRLSNPGSIDLVIIEVQVGEYLGEDDIVRLEDDYLRNMSS